MSSTRRVLSPCQLPLLPNPGSPIEAAKNNILEALATRRGRKSPRLGQGVPRMRFAFTCGSASASQMALSAGRDLRPLSSAAMYTRQRRLRDHAS